ncbi:MAG TPA: hypothetical protein DHM90_01050 [Clostridiaceae bacterium]|nr:hypothetical protein [Clostridiaceae bacterium]
MMDDKQVGVQKKAKSKIRSHSNKIGLMGKVLLVLLLMVIIFVGTKALGEDKGGMEIVTISDLQDIIGISEFNTFQAVYNGIAEVKNKENSEKVDYYVSYNAKVKVGFDFNKLIIDSKEKEKIIELKIPDIIIQDVNVDMGTLDYIFINDKVNRSGVSDEAYDACIEDAIKESSEEDEIFEIARANAENSMKALVTPFIKDTDYELKVIFGGEE